MADTRIGVLGASSFVGQEIGRQLRARNLPFTAFSRSPRLESGQDWRVIPCPDTSGTAGNSCEADPLYDWISVAPIWALPECQSLLERSGARRIVALSSTSRFTKAHSTDPRDQVLARRIASAEGMLERWAAERGIACIILRPTLIYGLGKDRNIMDIARFVRRFGFFPVVGTARGLRQPVHVEDVASACLAALSLKSLCQNSYTLSGGEILTYREMVMRVFQALDCQPRIVQLPRGIVSVGTSLCSLLPRYRHVTVSMAERMSMDMIFDHSEATRDLGFDPRPFKLNAQDVAGKP